MAYIRYPNTTGSFGNTINTTSATAYPSQTNPIVWVQGEAGAKSQYVPAGQSALFMDSENPTFYIKTVDASGFPQPLRIFDFTERVAEPINPEPQDMSMYVTKDDLEETISKLIDKKLKTTKGGKK